MKVKLFFFFLNVIFGVNNSSLWDMIGWWVGLWGNSCFTLWSFCQWLNSLMVFSRTSKTESLFAFTTAYSSYLNIIQNDHIRLGINRFVFSKVIIKCKTHNSDIYYPTSDHTYKNSIWNFNPNYLLCSLSFLYLSCSENSECSGSFNASFTTRLTSFMLSWFSTAAECLSSASHHLLTSSLSLGRALKRSSLYKRNNIKLKIYFL